MSWILWVVFLFQDGSNLRYPLEVYDMENQCQSQKHAARAQYTRMTPILFPKNEDNVKVKTECLAAAHT